MRAHLRPQPPAPHRDEEERELGCEQGRQERRQQRPWVHAEHRQPAVALEQEPLLLALRELVVVLDDRAARHPDAPAREPQPQRQVQVLAVHEVVRVEAAGGVPRAPPHDQRRARREPDRAVLARVRDTRAVAARPADAEPVHLAAARVDLLAARQRHDRLPRAPIGVRVRRCAQRVEAPRRRHGVGVQEEQQRSGGGRGAGVAAAGEPQVAVEPDESRPFGGGVDRSRRCRRRRARPRAPAAPAPPRASPAGARRTRRRR